MSTFPRPQFLTAMMWGRISNFRETWEENGAVDWTFQYNVFRPGLRICKDVLAIDGISKFWRSFKWQHWSDEDGGFGDCSEEVQTKGIPALPDVSLSESS